MIEIIIFFLIVFFIFHLNLVFDPNSQLIINFKNNTLFLTKLFSYFFLVQFCYVYKIIAQSILVTFTVS